MKSITATRHHDFSCGHRIVGHEGKCRFLHGHNYRVHFTAQAGQLDNLGRVVDFSAIKNTLCQWLEDNWDHKFVMWAEDPLQGHMNKFRADGGIDLGIVLVPFNPTAENMGLYLMEHVAPMIFNSPDLKLIRVDVEETRKCFATIADMD